MPTLLSPFELRSLHLRNRIVMPPMANYLATPEGAVTPKLIAHYAARSKDVGLTIVEHSYVLPSGPINRQQLGVHRDDLIPGLASLVDAIHAAGARAGIQITHGGSASSSEVLGETPVAPSPIPHPKGGETPREMTVAEIKAVVEAFAAAAKRVKAAGFDVVEIHGAHGYLLNQFYSPLTNKRQDEYGGSREARLRLMLEVATAVRAAVGPDYPVFMRLGVDDGTPGGLTLGDGQYAAPHLMETGIDVLDVSGGFCGSRPEGLTGQGYFVPLAIGIKTVVPLPVLVAGGFTDPRAADATIRERHADLIGVGRALLTDPEWAVKAVAALS